jgi:hypothetical protein
MDEHEGRGIDHTVLFEALYRASDSTLGDLAQHHGCRYEVHLALVNEQLSQDEMAFIPMRSQSTPSSLKYAPASLMAS